MESEDAKSIFPSNITLQEVRDCIAGRVEFREIDGGDHVVFLYFLGQAEDDNMFPDPADAPDAATARSWAIRRECRGIVFSKEGHILSRRFHKFFNIGELPETEPSKIPWHEPFVALTKLDGSMIAPFYTQGLLSWATRHGVTDVGHLAAKHVMAKEEELHYELFCAHWLAKGYTPMFEWCSRKSKIVLDYPQDRLTLIALRNMKDGSYVWHDDLVAAAQEYNIPVVQQWNGCSLGDGDEDVLTRIKEQVDVEGFVLVFRDGRRFKIKTNWYFKANHTLDHFFRAAERFRWKLVLNNEYDDLIPLLDDSEVKRMAAFIHALVTRLRTAADRLIDTVQTAHEAGMESKDFAKQVVPKQPRSARGLLFSMFNGNLECIPSAVTDHLTRLLKGTFASRKRFDAFRGDFLDNLSVFDFELESPVVMGHSMFGSVVDEEEGGEEE